MGYKPVKQSNQCSFRISGMGRKGKRLDVIRGESKDLPTEEGCGVSESHK